MWFSVTYILYFGSFIVKVSADVLPNVTYFNVNTNNTIYDSVLKNNTRRILKGHVVGETRPYMVYLRPAPTAATQFLESNWLCGGVIIHPLYVLTSAACIEDVKNFYVVSGTHKWLPQSERENECIKYGAKKATWKCVPSDYNFDGKSFENIQWLNNDIAVVKVEDEFNFKKRVKGCDFIPKMIQYNNKSKSLEKPKTVGAISGWGTSDRYTDAIIDTDLRQGSDNANPTLMETDVEIISKKNCKKRWNERYHNIIDQFMICSRDHLDAEAMDAVCTEQVKCKELNYDEEDDDEEENNEANGRRLNRRMTYRFPDPESLKVHGGYHQIINSRKANKISSGGFCQNDHGGPLVVGYGASAVVIGVQSACQTQEINQKCFGPFLYTSVWNNRVLINCAIYKFYGATCLRVLKATESQTYMNWTSHPDGPAKDEK